MHQNLQATGTHISLIAHITQRDLAQHLSRTEAQNGFANRCLWTWVQRGNCLPEGGTLSAADLSRLPANSAALSTGPLVLPKSSSAGMRRPATFGKIAIPP